MCRCEVHLVKYLVPPLSQLNKTFRGGAQGHFVELKLTTFPHRGFSHRSISGRVYPNWRTSEPQGKGEVLLCKKSNASSWFCKRTRRFSKHWVRESVKVCAELAELLTSLGVHGHVLKHGLESIAAEKTELMIIYVKFVELSYAEFLFRNMVEEELLDLECLHVLWKKTPHTQH
ncbi:hypothetical protein PVL29_022781 [Vitis rotundifolia]|uniref:Uncharacterized protein n=1 Tax=Vitis rotundifolia TaxID=103349 RepID=A0AA38YWI2_VITRO|nr:hypothetical protein PVL29_022781 [Vitis rotundifolia]